MLTACMPCNSERIQNVNIIGQTFLNSIPVTDMCVPARGPLAPTGSRRRRCRSRSSARSQRAGCAGPRLNAAPRRTPPGSGPGSWRPRRSTAARAARRPAAPAAPDQATQHAYSIRGPLHMWLTVSLCILIMSMQELPTHNSLPHRSSTAMPSACNNKHDVPAW